MADTQYTSNLDGIKRMTDQKARIAAEIIGGKAESYAKMLCPVDTGNLRNSITHTTEDDGHTVVIGSTVYYAPFVELGTGRNAEGANGRGTREGMKPRPYLRPAIEDHREEYKHIIQSELKP